MQLICLAYKPESDKEYKQDESLMAAAQQAGRVLIKGKASPVRNQIIVLMNTYLVTGLKKSGN